MTKKLKRLMGLLLLLMATAVNGQTLFETQFEKVSDFEKFTVLDENEDGQMWQYDDIFLAARCDRDFDADDWLVTPALNLEKGKTYRLTFMANIELEDTEVLSVLLGEAAVASDFTTPLMENLQITSTSQKEYTTTYKATETGTFYIGFHYSTTGSGYFNKIYLTSIRVEETADQGVPAAITNLTITPDASGALKATIAFNAPQSRLAAMHCRPSRRLKYIATTRW